MNKLLDDLTELLNKHLVENTSNTPDYILADYMLSTLAAYECACQARDAWYGINPEPGRPFLTRRRKGLRGKMYAAGSVYSLCPTTRRRRK
jgi:hypothetical protein